MVRKTKQESFSVEKKWIKVEDKSWNENSAASASIFLWWK